LFFEKRAQLGGRQLQEAEKILVVLVMVVFVRHFTSATGGRCGTERAT
jgi:hypothetical protein